MLIMNALNNMNTFMGYNFLKQTTTTPLSLVPNNENAYYFKTRNPSIDEKMVN